MKKPLILVLVLSILYGLFFLRLLQNEAPPYAYDKPFFESLYAKSMAEELLDQIDRIKANPGWLENTKKQAQLRGISTSEMLKLNAKFMINQRKMKGYE
jgi:hypothetical protein